DSATLTFTPFERLRDLAGAAAIWRRERRRISRIRSGCDAKREVSLRLGGRARRCWHQAQLHHHAGGIVQTPMLGLTPVDDADDVDAFDIYVFSGGGHAHERSRVGPDKAVADDDIVAVSQHLVDLYTGVRESGQTLPRAVLE